MLEFKNFSLEYTNSLNLKEKLFENINVSFKKASINVITGQSGSGKSTLLKTINGIIPEITGAKLSGELVYNGKNLFEEDITQRSGIISTVFQNPKNQFFAVNSLDEIAFALENRNIPREEIFERINHYTEILSTKRLLDRDLLKLSGGEKQLVAISSVAVMDNDIYIFDEPSASVDNNSIEKLARVLQILKDMGKIIIIAEHRLYYLKNILDKLLIIKNKSLISYDKDEINQELINRHNLRSLDKIEKSELKNDNFIQKNLHDKSYNKYDKLICKNFYCKYRDKDKEIFDFSISFNEGIYFIIGENGIGKTSFIRNMCGLNKKQKGELYYNNKKVKNPNSLISLVMQDVNYQIFTESLLSEISIVTDDNSLKKETLKKFGLWEKKDFHPQSLSGGEKQRLMLALAYASPKEIVILDEPTSGLCHKNMINLIKILKKMKEQNKIIIIITHDYEFIKMAGGNVVEFVDEKKRN